MGQWDFFSLAHCVFFGLWDYETLGLCDDSADIKTFSLSRCLVVSLSFFLTMRLWDNGTVGFLFVVFLGLWDYGTTRPTLKLSHCLIVTSSHCPFFDNEKMGLCDYATTRPTNKILCEAHLTFHLSPFTFLVLLSSEIFNALRGAKNTLYGHNQEKRWGTTTIF